MSPWPGRPGSADAAWPGRCAACWPTPTHRTGRPCRDTDCYADSTPSATPSRSPQPPNHLRQQPIRLRYTPPGGCRTPTHQPYSPGRALKTGTVTATATAEAAALLAPHAIIYDNEGQERGVDLELGRRGWSSSARARQLAARRAGGRRLWQRHRTCGPPSLGRSLALLAGNADRVAAMTISNPDVGPASGISCCLFRRTAQPDSPEPGDCRGCVCGRIDGWQVRTRDRPRCVGSERPLW